MTFNKSSNDRTGHATIGIVDVSRYIIKTWRTGISETVKIRDEKLRFE